MEWRLATAPNLQANGERLSEKAWESISLMPDTQGTQPNKGEILSASLKVCRVLSYYAVCPERNLILSLQGKRRLCGLDTGRNHLLHEPLLTRPV